MHRNDQPEDCIVCMEQTWNALVPCNHRVCASCFEAWNATGHITCPQCRQVVVDAGVVPITVHTRVVQCAANDHWGVCLRDATQGSGILVERSDACDAAYKCGIRVGDTITHFNALAPPNAKSAVDILEVARVNALSVTVTLTARPRARWRSLRVMNVFVS